MRYLPNGSQMREGDLYTIEHIGIPSMVLMERAALQTVRVMEENKLDLSRPLIVCGSGNNGGDGFAIARLLNERKIMPTVVFIGNESSMSTQAAEQMQILKHRGLVIGKHIEDRKYTVIIDAVFGVGLSRNIEGSYAEMIQKLNRMSGTKVAVDIPSGINADTGAVLGSAFRADITVSYAFEKEGTVWYPGAEYAGEVYTVNIGILPEVFDSLLMKTCYTYDEEDLARHLPKRSLNSHKGSYGKVLMITGSKGMSGAAYLSARAAYITGAGLVQIYTTEDNREILQNMLPEAIITTYQKYDAKQLDSLIEWADVTAIGSGLGMSETSKKLVAETISHCGKKLVIDADALNILSEQMDLLHEADVQAVLTPHMMEMSRLLNIAVPKLQQERYELVEHLVNEYPVVLALKDARTLVSSKEEKPYINTSGNNAMAKAGSGDVLTGVIAGLLAQGMEPYEGTVLGVYLHGLAGDDAKRRKGSYSVLARDLIDGIGNRIKEIDNEGDKKRYEAVQQSLCKDRLGCN